MCKACRYLSEVRFFKAEECSEFNKRLWLQLERYVPESEEDRKTLESYVRRLSPHMTLGLAKQSALLMFSSANEKPI